ncbi:MAG: VWA domain-containing protein [Planctomycetota bacterium]
MPTLLHHGQTYPRKYHSLELKLGLCTGLLVFLSLFVTPTMAQSPVPAIRQVDEQRRDQESRFQAVRSEINRQLRHKSPEARLAALQRLQEYPCTAAAKLALTQALEQHPAEQHQAAVKTLMTYHESEPVCTYFHTLLVRDLQSRDLLPSMNSQRGGILLAALINSKLPDVQEDLEQRLERSGEVEQLPNVAWITLADELGQQGTTESVQALTHLTQTKLFANRFGFRRAVVQALINSRQKEAVDQLIALLTTVQGEVKGDIVRYLTRLRGPINDPHQAWEQWWATRRVDFKFASPVMVEAPGRAHDRPVTVEPLPDLPSYYQISVSARRIVFILDASNSMAGLRLTRAKETLIQAIQDLPEDTQFNVIAFHHAVYEWQRRLLDASFANKNAAVRFIKQQLVQSDTASYDALKAALRYDTEAIYFVTDGEPNAGRIKHPRDIIQAITQENYARRITLHTIGIGVGPAGNNFDSFLKELARQNLGEYRRVDE